jgi:hypothetical protein
MYWTDTYSQERDMAFRLRDNHREAQQRHLQKIARGDSSLLKSVREGFGRSLSAARSAADLIQSWSPGSKPQEQCC